MLTKLHNKYDIFDDYDSLFDSLFVKPLNRRIDPILIEGHSLSIDVPGVKKQDIQVYVDGHYLHVDTKRGENSIVKRKYYFDDTIFDTKSVIATLEDGVLTVKFEKFNEEKLKRIDIEVK